MNSKFRNAIERKPQACPPIWFMRQAGRYHKHYQALRAQHSFETLCREPELAAQVALGPIQDFDFDVAILFSDLLFPLDGLGMELSYTDAGPHLNHSLQNGFQVSQNRFSQAVDELQFQGDALRLTRELLPKDKSLIGFVGGLWTLYVYACEGGHAGSLTYSKSHLGRHQDFISILDRLIRANIELQLKAGAEIVMVFDTSAGELSAGFFKEYMAPILISWAQQFPGRLGYYSKGTQASFFTDSFVNAPWAGRGVDHRWSLPDVLRENAQKEIPGFLQGNFDQALLFQDKADFEKSLLQYLAPFRSLSSEQRAAWVCGLGHGVLPKTPEAHVHLFIETIRREME